ASHSLSKRPPMQDSSHYCPRLSLATVCSRRQCRRGRTLFSSRDALSALKSTGKNLYFLALQLQFPFSNFGDISWAPFSSSPSCWCTFSSARRPASNLSPPQRKKRPRHPLAKISAKRFAKACRFAHDILFS